MVIQKNEMVRANQSIKTLFCDWCGEGMGISDDNSQEQQEFRELHEDCQKPQNPNI